MAYDGTLAEPTLFGGYDGTTVLGDTWEYSGTNDGSSRPRPPSPPARADAAMADNSTDGQLVLFGGQATTGRLLGPRRHLDLLLRPRRPDRRHRHWPATPRPR